MSELSEILDVMTDMWHHWMLPWTPYGLLMIYVRIILILSVFGIMWKHFPRCWPLVWGIHHRWFPLARVGNTYVSLLCCIIIYITVRSLIICVRAIAAQRSYTLMMTSWYGSIFCIAGPLCGESIGHRWLPLARAGNAYVTFWCCIIVYVTVPI